MLTGPRGAGARPRRCRPAGARAGDDVLARLALARYEGSLSYAEVLTAVLTRSDGTISPRLTVPQVWVTSAASVAGARVVGHPQEPCGVDLRTSRGTVRAVATTGGRALLELDARVGRRLLPRRVALPLVTAQRREGGGVVARHVAGAQVHSARVGWRIAPPGRSATSPDGARSRRSCAPGCGWSSAGSIASGDE